jgi:hypothetical protein
MATAMKIEDKWQRSVLKNVVSRHEGTHSTGRILCPQRRHPGQREDRQALKYTNDGEENGLQRQI